MKILLDIDGVVCHYDFSAITKKHFGVAIPNESIYTYSIEDSLGVSTKEVERMFDIETWSPPNFVKDSTEILEEFTDKGYNIIIYSSRIKFMGMKGLVDWLNTYGIPYSNIIDKESMLRFGVNNVDYHIDDSPTKLMNLGNLTKNKLLFDTPWNKQCLNIHNKLVRVYSWSEIREIVNGS